jgi:hypothetical protein
VEAVAAALGGRVVMLTPVEVAAVQQIPAIITLVLHKVQHHYCLDLNLSEIPEEAQQYGVIQLAI